MTRYAYLCALALTTAAPLAAQQTTTAQPAAASPATAPALRVAPSGRATTVVSLSTPRVQGQPAPKPLTISIDYGQPHARSRTVWGQVVPMGQVWRTGANAATELRTDVDLVIGGTRVPKGAYTLFTLPTESGTKLIINKQTGQWGTNYDAAQDLARVDLRVAELPYTVESFTITLVPGTESPARGVLRLVWGNRELTADWRVAD